MKRLIVVAGAAKAGTTTIVDALDSLPDFDGGRLKEPRHFYGRDHAVTGPLADRFERTRLRSWDDYLANYASDSPQMPIDGSTDYLNDQSSAGRISDSVEDVRVIIGIRHPVTRAFSEHQHLVRNGAETRDFLTALNLEEERRSHGWVPLFGHVERSLISAGVSTFIETFGRSNVFVYRFEDLAEDPANLGHRLRDFLGVHESPDLQGRKNIAGRPRSSLLNTALRGDGRLLRGARQIVGRSLPRRTTAEIRNRIDRVNLDRSEAPTEQAIEWILERTRDDYCELEEVLGVDLASYRQA